MREGERREKKRCYNPVGLLLVNSLVCIHAKRDKISHTWILDFPILHIDIKTTQNNGIQFQEWEYGNVGMRTAYTTVLYINMAALSSCEVVGKRPLPVA